jgi:O-antigen ligase
VVSFDNADQATLSGVRGRLAGRDWGFIATSGFVLACLIMGGGAAVGFLSDVVIQLLAIPVLLVSLWRYLDVPAAERPPWALTLGALMVALPALQLVPLPPSVWTSLPGRQPLVESFTFLDRELPWAPISVAPTGTWLSLMSLLPPLAVFFATLLMSFRQRRQLSLVILAFGAGSVFLGLTQVAEGPSSPLRFFANTNPSEAVGFFANRNHFAALLYVMILLAAAWASDAAMPAGDTPGQRRFEVATVLPMLGCFTLLVVFVAGEVMTRSRAGLGLTMVALLGTFLLAYSDRRAVSGMTPAKLLLGLAVLTAIFLVQLGLYRVLERFGQDPLADDRIPFARNTMDAALGFFPIGSGLGTFVTVYGAFEKTNDLLPNTFANHTHNDALELWLETGLAGAVIAALCAVWIIRQTVRVWRAGNWEARGVDLLLARAASLAIGLVIAHSLFDYPLRTSAMMMLLAFCCALLTTPARHVHTDDDGVRESGARRQEPVVRPVPAIADAGSARRPSLSGERWGRGIEWPDAWRKPGGAPNATRRGRSGSDEGRGE